MSGHRGPGEAGGVDHGDLVGGERHLGGGGEHHVDDARVGPEDGRLDGGAVDRAADGDGGEEGRQRDVGGGLGSGQLGGAHLDLSGQRDGHLRGVVRGGHGALRAPAAPATYTLTVPSPTASATATRVTSLLAVAAQNR